MSNIMAEAIALRDRAWAEVEKTKEYKAYLALKGAVEVMAPPPEIGGRQVSGDIMRRVPEPVFAHNIVRHLVGRRPSQADAAVSALKRVGKPLSAIDLMAGATKEGAVIGGERPLTNFTSSLSKDERLFSFRHNGSYFWWLEGEPLGDDWNEATDPDLLNGSVASSSSSQEGGDAHAATTAN